MSIQKSMHGSQRLKSLTVVIGLLLLTGAAVVSIIVQVEADYTLQAVGGAGKARALVLFHPSRDARFSDDLSRALAEGFIVAGFAVDRATLTNTTPGEPSAYKLIGVVSNTYYWTPDLPTLWYLKRAQLQGIAVVGVIGGAGSTARAQRLLDEALRRTGAQVIATRAFWLWRPNDESRMSEPNRGVAVQLTKQLGVHAGTVVLATQTHTP